MLQKLLLPISSYFFGVKREKVQESFLVGKGGITTTVLLFATHPTIEYHCTAAESDKKENKNK